MLCAYLWPQTGEDQGLDFLVADRPFDGIGQGTIRPARVLHASSVVGVGCERRALAAVAVALATLGPKYRLPVLSRSSRRPGRTGDREQAANAQRRYAATASRIAEIDRPSEARNRSWPCTVSNLALVLTFTSADVIETHSDRIPGSQVVFRHDWRVGARKQRLGDILPVPAPGPV
jgi:hypothetical protein